MNSSGFEWIELTDLAFDCVVGILESEQRQLQPLVVNLKMFLSIEEAASTGKLDTSVDYAAVAEQVKFIGTQGRWRLIESFATACCRLLLSKPAPAEARGQIERIEFQVKKPQALGGLATPGLWLRRKADWVASAPRKREGQILVEQLEATPLSAAYRVHIAAGAAWQMPWGVTALVISGAADAGSQSLTAGSRLPRGADVTVRNTSAHTTSLLVVGDPVLL